MSCADPRHIFQIQRLIQPVWLTVTATWLALGWESRGFQIIEKLPITLGSAVSDDTTRKTPGPHDPQFSRLLSLSGAFGRWCFLMCQSSCQACRTVWLRCGVNCCSALHKVRDLICLPTLLLVKNVSVLVAVFFFVFCLFCMCPCLLCSPPPNRLSAGQVYYLNILDVLFILNGSFVFNQISLRIFIIQKKSWLIFYIIITKM